MASREELVAKHVDACATLLGVQVIALIAYNRKGNVQLICPENRRVFTLHLLSELNWSDAVWSS